MSNNNINQVLSRNLPLFQCQSPLLINLPYSEFVSELLAHNSACELTSFNSNYADYQSHKNKPYQSYFGAIYQENHQHDLVIIQFPKSKQELPLLLAMLWQVANEQTQIVLVGEKNSGINASKKLVEPYLRHYQKHDAARHCMIFIGHYIIPNTFNVEDWYQEYQLKLDNTELTIAALPGVFSQKQLDIGTRVLLENLPTITAHNILDFGCGAGVIACFIAKHFNLTSSLTLADVSALALTSAQKTCQLNQIQADFVATNSLSDIQGMYDCVISNPPFHQGIKTNYQATEQFLAGINKHISAKGQLLIVANSFLHYQPIMAKAFTNVTIKANQKGFTVYQCKK